MNGLPRRYVFSLWRELALTSVTVLSACQGGQFADEVQPHADPSVSEQPVALAQAHAHNDYEHPRPLLDALDQGFMSVEADVFAAPLPPDVVAMLPISLPGLSTLYVAHDPQDIRPQRTLRTLYLDPLWERYQSDGQLYPDQVAPLQLLVDFKTDAETTWLVLEPILADYAPMLTRLVDGVMEEGMVTVVISGNRPTATMAAQGRRLAFIDGRLGDLESPSPVELMPLISDNWGNHFGWRGVGPMPEDERALLLGSIQRTHALGARLRFWATPDTPGPAREAVWSVLADAGLDHINTDDLEGLAQFLRARAQTDLAP